MDGKTKRRHPSRALLEKIGKGGMPRPLSISEQWKQVADWHAFLESESVGDYPMPDGLNEGWKALEPLYDFYGKSVVERGEELERVASTPLAAMFYFIEMGFYPPPELLFALSDTWRAYVGGSGHISLEQAFFGKRIQKSGNFAKRESAKFVRLTMRWNFERFIRDGMTRTQAAEAISAVYGGKPEPESILRLFRTKGAKEPAKRKNKT